MRYDENVLSELTDYVALELFLVLPGEYLNPWGSFNFESLGSN